MNCKWMTEPDNICNTLVGADISRVLLRALPLNCHMDKPLVPGQHKAINNEPSARNIPKKIKNKPSIN